MSGIYKKKWEIKSREKVATAGSCFAQHIARYMRSNNFSVMDVELPPKDLPLGEQEKLGYGQYSARFGNIYTVHQLLQLAKEAFGVSNPEDVCWEKNGRFFDALRPATNPLGYASDEDLYESRGAHLQAVKKMFLDLDVFVFTMGLTEAWIHKPSNTVFPTAPETIAGVYDPDKYEFKNFNFGEIVDAFEELLKLLRCARKERPQIKFLLTVSPVPLTATAGGKHVLLASTYSKSVLRAVAGYLDEKYSNIDYFPSYEIITNPAARSNFYDENLRTVKTIGVESVMKVFFEAHGLKPTEDRAQAPTSNAELPSDDVQCEDILLETFAGESSTLRDSRELIVFIGDSHISGLKNCIQKYYAGYEDRYRIVYIPVSWLVHPLMNLDGHKNLTFLQLKDEYRSCISSIPSPEEMQGARICFVGIGMLGDGVVRAFGTLSAGEALRHEGEPSGNPRLPILGPIHKIDSMIKDKTLIPELEDFAGFQRNHIHPLNIRINIYNGISGSGIYRSVHWVASPNMVERTARFRFGDDYVESRSHSIHTRIAEAYIDGYMSRHNQPSWLIKHDAKLEVESGFTSDVYAFNDSINDIHTNAEFYVGALSRYFKAID